MSSENKDKPRGTKAENGAIHPSFIALFLLENYNIIKKKPNKAFLPPAVFILYFCF